MPVSPDGPRTRRSKAHLTEEALASRVAASLDPKTIMPSETVSRDLVPAKALAAPEPAPKPAQAPAPKSSGAPSELFEAGVGRVTEAVSSAQEMARDTARSLADTRLKTAHSIVAFQKKLLEMVHANLNEGFAVAQKIVAAPNVGEAIKAQSSFAQSRVKTLAGQAAELRSLSAQLAKEAQEPWSAHMAKSLKRVRTSLGAS